MYVLGRIGYIWVKQLKMKKLLYLLLAITFIGCSSDDNSSSNNQNGVDYFFEVEFGGLINRVQGNSSSTAPNGGPLFLYNSCFATTDGVNLSITDVTAESYVSGQNMELVINFDNAQLGNNSGNMLLFDGFYINKYLQSIGVNDSKFVENIGDGFGQRGKISNINITDLGTAGGFPDYGGETLKASYEKVVYFRSIDTGEYDIPVPIRIEFNAVRL